MAGAPSTNLATKTTGKSRRALRDPLWVRVLILTIGLAFLAFFLLVPLAAIFTEALRKGLAAYFKSFDDKAAWSAIKLTLTVAAIAVPLNVVFGVIASWCIAKFNFLGKNLLLTLIDLPFAVSPVISGLIYVLVFGSQGWLGDWLKGWDFNLWWPVWQGFSDWWPIGLEKWRVHGDVKIIFAVPGIVLATVFVTFPFVARELIPLMQAQGNDEEEAAIVLGASGLQTFFRVTLPNIKWALLYGVILCNARAMGEFGAVSVVSGHIRGKTNTVPLHVEILYNEYNFVAAFACASLLAILALITLVLKTLVEGKVRS